MKKLSTILLKSFRVKILFFTVPEKLQSNCLRILCCMKEVSTTPIRIHHIIQSIDKLDNDMLMKIIIFNLVRYKIKN